MKTKGDGCLWLALAGCFGLAILAVLLMALPSVLPEEGGHGVNMGARPTATPRPSTSTVTVMAASGEKIERPSWMIGLWVGTGLAVLFVAMKVFQSAPAAQAAHVPGAGCGAGLATVAVIVVVICIAIGVVSMTMGGG